MGSGSQHGQRSPGETLRRYYTTLLESFGPQGSWPARTRWEVICGAVLTQNTTWRNATIALNNLETAGHHDWRSLRQISPRELEELIRPAGSFRQKARTLRNFANFIELEHAGSLDSLFALGATRARAQLMSLNGIGAETADAILLYCGRLPVFVADAYTRRVLSRHQFLSPSADYQTAQQFLHLHLPPDEPMFNEFHALLVETAKRYCHRKVAHCEECPLGKYMGRNAKPAIRNSAREPDFEPLAAESQT